MNGFELVTIRVEHERTVIGVTVLRANAGCTIADSARNDGDLVKCINLKTGLRGKGDMPAILGGH